MTATPRPELPVVAGDLALDFANTVDDPEGPERYDHLDRYASLTWWTDAVGALPEPITAALDELAERDPAAASEALVEAHRLRDALNDVFGTLVDRPGQAVDDLPGWSVIRTTAARAITHAVPDGDGERRRWAWSADDGLDVPLFPVALAAIDLLVSPRLARLKRCGRCPWLFLDTSRNHSRRWCDMDACGRAEKIERYVARRAERRRARQQP